MKIDKEALAKNQFWILLGAALLLWVIALAMLKMQGPSAVAEKFAKYDKADKDIKAALSKGPKNKSFLEPWEKHGETFRSHKDKVWAEAWTVQQGMMTWPRADFQAKLRYPTDPFSTAERSEYRNTLYITQFADLDREVLQFPDLYKKMTPVEFKGGVQAVIPPINWVKTPTREECWLAQEDFWVKREMLRIVHDVLETVGNMEEVKIDPKKDPVPEGALARRRFHNSYWEIDLVFEKGERPGQQIIGPRSLIKNTHIGRRTQPLANPRTHRGLIFRLDQGDSYRYFQVVGEPLAWGEVREFKAATPVGAIDYRKPFNVHQVFDRDNSPVRRIDVLEVGARAQSNRTQTVALKPQDLLKKMDAPTTDDTSGAGATGAAAGSGGMPGSGAMAGPAGSGMGGPGRGELGGGMTPGGPGAGPVGDPTPNNLLERNRYIQVTDQCRHLPVGLVLIVDQAHIQDVLVAVANSRLRVQVTQVDFEHAHGYVPAASDAEEGAVEGMEGGRATPPMMAAETMPGMPGAAGQGTARVTEDPNLVELSVYGIAALYGRPGVKPAEGTGTPAATQP